MHILVNTGGGDAPGLNAVIRAVTLSALNRGWKVTGIRRGYEGLLRDKPGGLMDQDRKAVRGITFLGGTILGTVNKGNPFEYPVEKEDGSIDIVDISDTLVAKIKETGADALVCIGGDGSLRIANKLHKKGVALVGVPKTIDNDLFCTDATFGFDTAVSIATEAIDRLHSTAESHRRVMVVEVMGRYAGWIALNSGIAGTADVILLPLRQTLSLGRESSKTRTGSSTEKRGPSLASQCRTSATRTVRRRFISNATAPTIGRSTTTPKYL